MEISKEKVAEKLKEKFNLSDIEVCEYFSQYWKEV